MKIIIMNNMKALMQVKTLNNQITQVVQVNKAIY